MNKDIAEETSFLALEVVSLLESQLQKIQDSCPDDDVGQMRSDICYIMGLLYTDLMEPLWKLHPDLRPQEEELPYFRLLRRVSASE